MVSRQFLKRANPMVWTRCRLPRRPSLGFVTLPKPSERVRGKLDEKTTECIANYRIYDTNDQLYT